MIPDRGPGSRVLQGMVIGVVQYTVYSAQYTVHSSCTVPHTV